MLVTLTHAHADRVPTRDGHEPSTTLVKRRAVSYTPYLVLDPRKKRLANDGP